MSIVLVVCCIVDPIVFTLDGRPGFLVRFILYFGNFLLYLSNLVFAPTFLLIIEKKTKGSNSKLLLAIIVITNGILALILILNFFKPIIFYVDEFNRYQRLGMFYAYTALGVSYSLVALVIYVIARIQGGVFKTFPAFELVMPTILGLWIQSQFYGISIIWPATAVGLTLMVLSLQNRNLIVDAMTGLYNRKYLDYFINRYKTCCMMMLDLNGFKSINDNYGHSEGDVAIIKTGELLLKTAGTKGTAVRYAGDEFIVLLNINDPEDAKKYIDRLKHNFEEYYSSGQKPYKVTFSVGYGIFDFKDSTLDEVLRILDQRMYDNKREYYKHNDRRKHR